nr:hypothetical protein [Mycobacterium sp.]
MVDERAVVLVAPYQDSAAAQRDFDGLRAAAEANTVPLRGAVLVAKDADGTVTVADAGWGAAAGDMIAQAVPAGTGVVVAVVPESGTLELERTLRGFLAKSVVGLASVTPEGLQAALFEAAREFIPDRTRLPLPDVSFSGVAGRTLSESIGDWPIAAGV